MTDVPLTTPYPSGSVILAPLSGYTDLPYRRSARRHGAYYVFTEMVDAASLAYNNKGSRILLERGADEPWLGVQLVGSDPGYLDKAVEEVNRHQFELLDFNLGCPVPKVVKKNAGAALAARPDEAASLLSRLVSRCVHPVTAKIRILDECDPEPTLRLARLLEDAGARAITVHGRIRQAFYSGPVHHGIIRAVRETVKIQVIANGGIMDMASCAAARAGSGCDGVMVARGAMGNPWIFRELQGTDYRPPTAKELAGEILLHVLEMIDYYGEAMGLRIARKVMLDYVKGRGFNRQLKAEISLLSTRGQLEEYVSRIGEESSSRRLLGKGHEGGAGERWLSM